MSALKSFKPLCALFVLAVLVGCIDPQVGVRRTGQSSSANSANRVPLGPKLGEHVVQKGETLYALSFKYAVDFRDIARWNGIIDPYTIYPNQRLLLRDPNAAPVLAASAVRPRPPVTTTSTTSSGVVVTTIPVQTNASSQPINAGNVVESGNGVSVATIATPAPLANAQPLNAAPGSAESPVNAQGMPVGFADGAAAQTNTATASNRPGVLPAAAPAIVAEADIVAPISASVPGVKPTAGRNGWGWPAYGKLIGTFASADPARQGIDIAGNFGDLVYAANAGDVVYSGRGIIGYGELIVIKHDDATLTAYGHNRRRLVKEGQRIKQGETIAEMGRDTRGRALLHFELRRNGKPVDPLGVLPAHTR